jgi:uncharacterized lipoprotein YbaY
MAEEVVVIEGGVLIDPPAAFENALAIVRLRDTRMADAPSEDVASIRIPCSGTAVRRIPFRIAATIDPERDYSLAAEVRRGGGDRLRPGDLLTVEHHGWRADDRGRDVALRTRTVS